MATRKPKPTPEPLPALDALPPVPMDHSVLHRIVNSYVSGTSMTAIAKKLELPAGYAKAVIHHYLLRYE